MLHVTERRVRDRRAQQEQRIRAMHPSNRLYSGDVSDFSEAMELVRAQCGMEAGFLDAGTDPLTGRPYDSGQIRALAAAAERALVIYDEEYAALKQRVLDRLRAENMTDIAAAFEAGEYDGLVI